MIRYRTQLASRVNWTVDKSPFFNYNWEISIKEIEQNIKKVIEFTGCDIDKVSSIFDVMIRVVHVLSLQCIFANFEAQSSTEKSVDNPSHN